MYLVHMEIISGLYTFSGHRWNHIQLLGYIRYLCGHISTSGVGGPCSFASQILKFNVSWVTVSRRGPPVFS